MARYLVLMHIDAAVRAEPAGKDQWDAYIERLAKAGYLEGGSSFGPGKTLHKSHVPSANEALSGYLYLDAPNAEIAQELCLKNPDYLAGHSVSIFPLIEDS
jgi:hypothetical protein